MPTPTVGDAVHYTPAIPVAPMNWVGGQPLPAVITVVHNDQLVAIKVTDIDDQEHQVPGVNYLQAGDTTPAAGNYCVPA